MCHHYVSVGSKVDQDNFTMKGSAAMGFNVGLRDLLDLCLAQNNRRFAPYDERLLRPQLMSRLARLGQAVLRKPEAEGSRTTL